MKDWSNPTEIGEKPTEIFGIFTIGFESVAELFDLADTLFCSVQGDA